MGNDKRPLIGIAVLCFTLPVFIMLVYVAVGLQAIGDDVKREAVLSECDRSGHEWEFVGVGFPGIKRNYAYSVDSNESSPLESTVSVEEYEYCWYSYKCSRCGKYITLDEEELSDEQIEEYINSEDVLDKAGAFYFQGKGAVLIERIDGCYFNVVGLPLFKLNSMLSKVGISIFDFK